MPALVAPMGVSSVLLFAVPASPLAQPWSIIGGNTLSALAGIACAMLIPDPTYAGAFAVAAAIGVMSLTRCLHPPGGAAALTAVLGGPAIAAAGWSFALVPIALNSVILVAIGWAFNNATRHSYPHRVKTVSRNTHGTADPAPQDRVGYTTADIDSVLARYDELLDVSRDDLDALFRQVEAQAHRRLHGEIRCEKIMSRDIIYAIPEEGVGLARDRLLARRLARGETVGSDSAGPRPVWDSKAFKHLGVRPNREDKVDMPLGTRHEFTGTLEAIGSDLVLHLNDGRKWTLLATAGIERFVSRSIRVTGIRGEEGTLHVTGFALSP